MSSAPPSRAEEGTEWFWRIVDADGLGDVPSEEIPALRLLCDRAARTQAAEARASTAEARIAVLEAALKGCLNEMNWQIDAHGRCNTYGEECPLHDASKPSDSHFLARAAARAALAGGDNADA